MSQFSEPGRVLLHARGLCKSFGEVKALDGVDFTLAPGEFLTLLGPSGSGKTTTLMTVAGFIEPTAGKVLYEDRDITRLFPEARGFGMVFQGYALFPHMTVEQNVRFPLAIRGIARGEADQRVKRALDQVQLGAYAKRYPRQLSGGQQQRVALARALVYEPRILLLDEPLSALDKKLRTDLQWELRKLNKESGASFLYVTHDQEEALSMSDRIAIFNQGRIAQIGTPVQLYEQPANLFVAGFLGRSNVLDATVRESCSDGLYLDYEGGVVCVSNAAAWRAGDRVSLVTRPHRLRMRDPSVGLPATVQEISYVGNLVHYLLRTTAGEPLYVECAVGSHSVATLMQGDRVGVTFDEGSLSVLEPRVSDLRYSSSFALTPRLPCPLSPL